MPCPRLSCSLSVLPQSFTRPLKMLVVNGNVVVSTFFVISGFLEARHSMMELGKMRRLSPLVVLVHCFHRFLRWALTTML